MAELKYVTRNQSDPRGLPKVLFASNPKDWQTFFRTVSDDILSIRKASVWYDDRRVLKVTEEELVTDIASMQLIVIPVTTRFLKEESSARDVILPFAVKEGIPVLPLMTETGLEPLFDSVCGELQCLPYRTADPAGKSWEVRFGKYLETVLLGDALTEKIRSAFDAYMFLSYRKKDRKYAAELMKLIHKNDFARDIAIWYDEYLVPGENFTDAIKKALEKSDLFGMLVTDNLVNEKNYVMEHEYPMASEAGKIRIPLMMETADPELLKRYYKDIPDTVDARDPEALSGALEQAVRHAAVAPSERTPEHEFFIGLAYLTGTDVECDPERGEELITVAASHGVAEAAKKLSDMYRYGEGVRTDANKALHWQQQYASRLEARFRESGKKEDGIQMLENFADTGNECMLQKWYQTACFAFDAMTVYTSEDRYPKDLRKVSFPVKYRMDALYGMAEACRNWGKYDDYRKYFTMAEEVRKKAGQDLGSVEGITEYIKNELRLASFQSFDGKAAEAYGTRKKLLFPAEALVGRDPSPLSRALRAECLKQAAESAVENGDRDDAIGLAEDAENEAAALASEERDRSYRRTHIECVSMHASVLLQAGRLHAAVKKAMEGEELARELMEETEACSDRLLLASCLNTLAMAYQLMFRTGKARKTVDRAVDIAEALAKEIPGPEVYSVLAECYFSYGIIRADKDAVAQSEYILTEMQKMYPGSVGTASKLDKQNGFTKKNSRFFK